MRGIQTIINQVRRGSESARNYFWEVCPLVTPEHAQAVLDAVPKEEQLAFRRMIVYLRSDIRIGWVGSVMNPSYFVDDPPEPEEGELTGDPLSPEFLRGLAILRQQMNAQGPLQLGDYLLMELDDVETWLRRCGQSDRPDIPDYKKQADLIRQLLKFHPPVVLAEYAVVDE